MDYINLIKKEEELLPKRFPIEVVGYFATGWLKKLNSFGNKPRPSSTSVAATDRHCWFRWRVRPSSNDRRRASRSSMNIAAIRPGAVKRPRRQSATGVTWCRRPKSSSGRLRSNRAGSRRLAARRTNHERLGTLSDRQTEREKKTPSLKVSAEPHSSGETNSPSCPRIGFRSWIPNADPAWQGWDCRQCGRWASCRGPEGKDHHE